MRQFLKLYLEMLQTYFQPCFSFIANS